MCSCGNIKDVNKASLKRGKSTSCGHEKRKPTIDLTGKVFSGLTVLRYDTDGKWLCQCICGNTKRIRGYDLLNKRIISCGHKNIDRNTLIGKRYEAWEVEGLSENTRYVRCRCECGTIADIDYHTLINGTSTNCGCRNKANLTGEVFGEWQVIGRSSNDSKWVCQCSCGTIQEHTASNLKLNRSLSCGCKKQS